jgi:hypothetical protein
MTSTQRTDIHRPVEMDPANYTFLFAYDSNHPMHHLAPEWQLRGEPEPNVVGGTCTHCGAHIRYIAVLRYLPTGRYILVGETCLDNRFSLESKAQFDALRKAAELDRAAQRIVKAATECIEALDTTPEAKAFLADKKSEQGHHIARDIRRKLWLYGSISAKQADLVAKLVAPKPATPATPEEVLVDAPEGRTTIQGVVLTVKWQESDFGGSLKMLVKVTTPQGVYKVWGSVPSNLDTGGAGTLDKGDTVRFDAQVTPRETGFAFYKRPTKAAFVARAHAADEAHTPGGLVTTAA